MTNTIAKLERMMIKHLGEDWDMADNDKMLAELIRRDTEHQAAIAAAVAAERERCAFVCEENSRKYKNAQQEIAALQCAKAIRAVK